MNIVPNEDRFETYKEISYEDCKNILISKYGFIKEQEDVERLTIYFVSGDEAIGEYNQSNHTLYLYEKDRVKDTNIRIPRTKRKKIK